MVVPNNRYAQVVWSEDLGKYERFTMIAGSCDVTFLVEDCGSKCVHPCSIGDIRHILQHIPYADWRGIRTIVLRRPTRKQRIISPVWGRLHYSAEFRSGRKIICRGPAISLDAVNCDDLVRWPTALRPHDVVELERLRVDGHRIERIGRRHIISITKESARSTQLYRTLLHEIGHWVDMLKHSQAHSGRSAGFELSDAYFARPKSEREAFAHDYAARMGARLSKFGIIPFDPL